MYYIYMIVLFQLTISQLAESIHEHLIFCTAMSFLLHFFSFVISRWNSQIIWNDLVEVLE